MNRDAGRDVALFTRSICLLSVLAYWIELLTSRSPWDLRMRFSLLTSLFFSFLVSCTHSCLLGLCSADLYPDTLICGQSKYQISTINLASRSAIINWSGKQLGARSRVCLHIARTHVSIVNAWRLIANICDKCLRWIGENWVEKFKISCGCSALIFYQLWKEKKYSWVVVQLHTRFASLAVPSVVSIYYIYLYIQNKLVALIYSQFA